MEECSAADEGQPNPIVHFFPFFFLIPTQTARLCFYSMECSANGVFMQVMAERSRCFTFAAVSSK